MRKGASGEEILDEIIRVWQARDDRYSEERGRINALSAKRRVEMSYIGG
jgi:cyclic pyranopterin phosphate synthase